MIESLSSEHTYYIIDPGSTSTSCMPSLKIEAKCILVSSPNSIHWGRNAFTKLTYCVMGVFMHCPLWSKEELLTAIKIFEKVLPQLPREDLIKFVTNRFDVVGGVPRHVFCGQGAYNEVLAKQNKAIIDLDAYQASRIVQNKVVEVDNYEKKQPASALLGYRLDKNAQAKDKFRKGEAVILSPFILHKIYHQHKKYLWNEMSSLSLGGRRMMMEPYARCLMAGVKGEKTKITVRQCVGPSNAIVYMKYSTRDLGGCSAIKVAPDLVEAAKGEPNVVFYSPNENFPLYDFIYQDNGHFHAFQVTTGSTHSADVSKIKGLEKEVGDFTKLSFYYFVLQSEFSGFKTDPVDPANPPKGRGVNCEILHAMIADPNHEIYAPAMAT